MKNGDENEIWMSKLNLNVNSIPVHLNEENFNHVNLYSHSYPNPFNSTTIIKFEIDKYSLVEIKIYNILGEKVNFILSMYKNPGLHKITWNGKDDSNNSVNSGVYFYQIKANNQLENGRMIYLK